MTTIAVTGAGGYLGGRLVARLREDPRIEVVALVRDRCRWLDANQRAVDLVADRVDAIAAALDGADVVVHLAGSSEVVAAAEPARAFEETVLASRRVGEAAEAAAVHRVVYVSTVHVYGDALVSGAGTPIVEDTPVEPLSLSVYAQSRLSSELVLEGSSGNFELVVFRLTNAVGAPAHPSVNRWTLVGNDLARQAVRDRRIVLRTPGMQHRDFVDLGDVCRTIASASHPGGVVPAGTFNLGSGTSLTIRALAECVQQQVVAATGVCPPIEAPAPDTPPDARSDAPVVVDIGRLRALGLAPSTRIEAAARETVQFCVTHASSLPST